LWVVLFVLLIGGIMAVLRPGGGSDAGALRMVGVMAWVGFVSGMVFGVVLSLAESGKAVAEISLVRAGLWGALSSAVFPLLTGRADQVAWTCPFGAIIAVGLVVFARRAGPGGRWRTGSWGSRIAAVVAQPVLDTVSPRRERAE
jgi:hypothetical protein